MSLKACVTGSLLGAVLGSALLMGGAEATGAAGTTLLPAGSCPSDAPDEGAVIDWVSFLVVDGVTFRAVYDPESGLRHEQVGAVVATVSCRIAGAVNDPYFRPRNGDAAFLAPGTQVHAVVGSPITVHLAVQEDGVWRLYEAEA